MPRAPIAALLSLAAAGASLASEEPEPAGVTVGLVADTDAVRPGEPFRLGALFRHDEGFHTYWKAPGIVGLPTRIDWGLPDGFEVSELEWPAPDFTHMFEYRAYGYERDALVFATVRPPASVGNLGDPVRLRARVTWMACAESCNPGTGVFELSLPVAASSDAPPPAPSPETMAAFAAAAGSVPRPIDLPDARATVDGETVTLRFTAEPGADLAGLEFLSDDNLFDPNDPQHPLPPPASGLALTLMEEPRPDPLPDRFRGLLYRPSGWPSAGGATFVQVTFPTVSE